MLSTARLILAIVCGSYLLSALLLAVLRYRGETVPGWVIAGWLVTGLIGLALLPPLRPGRWVVLVAIGIFLLPWMGYALVSDAAARRWVIAATDLAGLGAIVYSLWLVR